MAAPSRSLSPVLASPPAWLLAADDGERIVAALAEVVPELRSGELTLVSCVPKHLRLQDRACWEGSYRLSLLDAEGQRRDVRLVGELRPASSTGAATVTGRLGDDGWFCELPALGLRLRPQPPDAELPALGLLTDPERSRKLLEDIIGQRPAYRGFRIARSTPRIARHNLGERCTVVYRLEYDAEDAGRGWPELVVAKTYCGEKGAIAHAAMSALWDTSLATGEIVTLAEPLGYLASDRILVQGPIPEERTLKKMVPAALASGEIHALEAVLRQTAAGLAALHGCGVEHGDVLTLEEHLRPVDEIATLVERSAGLAPSFYAAVAPIVDLVRKGAAEHPPDALVPSHRSFRPAQVLLARGRIGFIDFDQFCRAEPALDVALFRATMKSIGIEAIGPQATDEARRVRLAEVDRLNEVFTDAYRELAPLSLERAALWETVDLLANVLNPWAKVKLDRLPSTTFALEEHLRTLR
jgi:hypothetical protein